MEIKDDTMSYFEMMDCLEEIFPSTSECDYTKVSPEELWQRALNFIEMTKITIPDDDLYNLKNEFQRNGKYLYGRKSVFAGREDENSGFDQNNYTIKFAIGTLKYELMERVYKERISYPTNGYFKGNFGSEESVREHISEEAIKKYIIDIFNMSAEHDNTIDTSNTFYYIGQIFLHFGFENNEQYNQDQEKAKICDIFRNAIEMAKNRSSISETYSDFSHLHLSQPTSMNMTRFDLETKKAIDEIVSYVSKKCNKMLENGISHNEKYDLYMAQQAAITQSPSETSVEELSQDEEKSESPVLEATFSEVTEQDFDTIITMYTEMGKIIEENKAITLQLAELEHQKQKLQSKLDQNNAKLQEVITGNGTK